MREAERRRLTRRLDELLDEAEHITAQLEQAKVEDRIPEQRHITLRVIRGGKTVLVPPFVWLGSQLRDHTASAATVAVAGAAAGALTLGAADPVERSREPVLAVTSAPTVPGDFIPEWGETPSPVPTRGVAPSTATYNEPAEILDLPMPAPTLLPELLPTVPPLPEPLPDVTVPPVENTVWTQAEAVQHCLALVGPLELDGCLNELLGG